MHDPCFELLRGQFFLKLVGAGLPKVQHNVFLKNKGSANDASVDRSWAEVSKLNCKISKYAECAIDPMDAIAWKSADRNPKTDILKRWSYPKTHSVQSLNRCVALDCKNVSSAKYNGGQFWVSVGYFTRFGEFFKKLSTVFAKTTLLLGVAALSSCFY